MHRNMDVLRLARGFCLCANLLVVHMDHVADANDGEHRVVRGRVLDSDGAPVAGVQVLEYGWESHPEKGAEPGSAVSDRMGEFLLKGLSNETIRFVLAIHADRKLKSIIRLPRFEGTPGEATVDFVVKPTASIKLKLIGEGEPLSGDKVRVDLYERVPLMKGTKESTGWRPVFDSYWWWSIPDKEGRSLSRSVNLPLESQTTIDAKGNAIVPNLAAEWSYQLDCCADGFKSKTLFDLRLKPGEVRDLGTIRLFRLRKLVVNVVDSQGNPVAGVKVVARPADDEVSPHPVSNASDKEGRIELSDVPDAPLTVKPFELHDSVTGATRDLSHEPSLSVKKGETRAKLMLKNLSKPNRDPAKLKK